jgi:hypothetical protein
MLNWRMFGLAGLLISAACGNSSDPSSLDKALASSTDTCQQAQQACDPSDTKKTTICHLPPGNPDNAHTLCVGNPAVPAHLAHGDRLGSCCDSTGGDQPPPTDDAGSQSTEEVVAGTAPIL